MAEKSGMHLQKKQINQTANHIANILNLYIEDQKINDLNELKNDELYKEPIIYLKKKGRKEISRP